MKATNIKQLVLNFIGGGKIKFPTRFLKNVDIDADGISNGVDEKDIFDFDQFMIDNDLSWENFESDENTFNLEENTSITYYLNKSNDDMDVLGWMLTTDNDIAEYFVDNIENKIYIKLNNLIFKINSITNSSSAYYISYRIELNDINIEIEKSKQNNEASIRIYTALAINNSEGES